MRKGDIVDLKIDSIAFGGAGVGRFREDDGDLVVFVDDTVPGDEVRAKIGSKKKTHAFGYVESFLAKSGKRIEPKCKHFGSCGDKCGGCSLQYLAYEDQLTIKEQHVKDALSRIGGLDKTVVAPIIGCEKPWYYRNKMEFSFSRDDDGRLCFGLHVRRRRYDMVELTECHLFSPEVGDFVKKMRDFIRDLDDRGIFIDGFMPMSLVVREGKNTGQTMVNLIVENGKFGFIDDFLNICKSKMTDLKSVYVTEITNKKGQRKKRVEQLIHGDPVIIEELGGLKYEISPQAFFQTNTLQAEKLFGLVADFADLQGEETVYDLFCGAGTIGLTLAKKAGKVVGIELNESAIVNARSNAKLNGLSNVEFMVGDVNAELVKLPGDPDVVIVDPPRNGLHAETIAKVVEFGPKKVIYVSCNPTTLARDLDLLTKTGYELKCVQPVDMFPQTYHIECVSLLEK